MLLWKLRWFTKFNKTKRTEKFSCGLLFNGPHCFISFLRKNSFHSTSTWLSVRLVRQKQTCYLCLSHLKNITGILDYLSFKRINQNIMGRTPSTFYKFLSNNYSSNFGSQRFVFLKLQIEYISLFCSSRLTAKNLSVFEINLIFNFRQYQLPPGKTFIQPLTK